MPDKDDVRPPDDPRYDEIFEISNLSREAKIGVMPMHPHNATLQTWLELGVVGALLYAMLFCLTLRALCQLSLSRVAMAGVAGLTIAVFTIRQLSFSAWQSWWLCYQFVVAAFFRFVVTKHSSQDAREGTARCALHGAFVEPSRQRKRPYGRNKLFVSPGRLSACEPNLPNPSDS